MSRLVAVATHHKTGTVWMRRVWSHWSETLGLPRIRVSGPGSVTEVPAEGRALLVSWNAAFPAELLDRADLRGMHLVRDPRDVLISGLRYHLIAPVAGERALHVPRTDLGGKTYQQHLNALPTTHARMLFEMENVHLDTLTEMTAWRYDRPNLRELRYEDLVRDRDMTLFADLLDFLGIDGAEKDTALDAYWANSLFGGFAEREARPRRVALHVQSGEPAQWETRMPRSVAEVYVERHNDALVALGYETDASWVARCPDEVETAALAGSKN
ncbi:hypothetical protein HKCCE2091_13895 [Rhodobacterales bacterium HKCCE2091]|nr:hypothetical protein [Rhodobacterales bacterium HKCCE2091]